MYSVARLEVSRYGEHVFYLGPGTPNRVVAVDGRSDKKNKVKLSFDNGRYLGSCILKINEQVGSGHDYYGKVNLENTFVYGVPDRYEVKVLVEPRSMISVEFGRIDLIIYMET